MLLAPSTVMTPSLPTFPSPRRQITDVPIVIRRDGADLEISRLSLIGLLSFLISSITVTTACSMPRLRSMGLAPAATFFNPSR